MLKKLTKLFSRLFAILIFVLLGQTNGFAQKTNGSIDISEEFQKIETYNKHIKTANYYHYANQKQFGKDVSWFLVGLSGAIGSVVLFGHKNEEVRLYGASALAGASLVPIFGALENKGDNNYTGERKALEEAKALFKNLPNKK
ncbi:hypothetical protein [Hymenobacter tenuis]